MNSDRQAHYFLLTATLLSLIVGYFIIQPFLIPLILAAVLAFLFQPVYRQALRVARGQAVVAALIVTLLAVLVIVLPLSVIGIILFNEASNIYIALSTGNGALLAQFNAALEHARVLLHLPSNFEFNISQYLRQGAAYAVQNLSVIFSSFARIILSLFVFVISFYFLLKDGEQLRQYLMKLSPLPDRDDEFISTRLSAAVRAVVVGNLTVGVIQGTVSGIGYMIFGLPHAALWGGITAVAALVPGAGTSLVILPAVLYLFFAGNTVGAIGLAAWGFAAVGLIDNLLGPRLVGRGMKLHPLLVMLSVLGGLALFGPLGFLLGPLAMSLCLAFLDIYFSLRPENTAAQK